MCFFFLSGFSFTNIDDSKDSQRKEESNSLILLYHFHPLHRHLDTSQAITTESSPLRIASRQTRTGNLCFLSASRQPIHYETGQQSTGEQVTKEMTEAKFICDLADCFLCL